jgi:hypothetical protein
MQPTEKLYEKREFRGKSERDRKSLKESDRGNKK